MLTSPSRRTSSPLFAGLSNGRDRERLAAIDVAAREDPFAVAGLDRAPHQNQTSGVDPDDRADGDLRIQVEDEAARRADEPFGLPRPDHPPLERAAAAGAEPIVGRLVVRAVVRMER
jgi:hypothetical protein